MATITTDTFLDDGTARTAGEAWTITDCRLTIRTDTRWHIGSPASMTGTFSALTCAGTTGSITIDGTKVRWMAFNTGTGTVPAIGTTITQGGVSGYFLGVWASLTAAPTAIGAAMPATGFIKFREVTGGTFSAGALTGISASATSADVVGWIEVVADHGTKITASTKGDFTTNGGWYELGTFNGNRNQSFQIPTNGSASGGTFLMGVQVETAVGSNVYEWWPVVRDTYNSSSYVASDARGKIMFTSTGGILYVGNSTGPVGYLLPTGVKLRIPNIFLRQCTAAARATNAVNATVTNRPTWNTGKFSAVTINNVVTDWYHAFTNFSNITVTDSAIDSGLNINHATGTVSTTSLAFANPSALNNIALSIANVSTSPTINNIVAIRMFGIGTTNFSFTNLNNTTISNFKLYVSSSSPNQYQIFANKCNNLNFTNFTTLNGGIYLSIVDGSEISNYDYNSTMTSSIGTGGSSKLLTLSNASNIYCHDITYGFNGTIAGQHPYGGIIDTTSNIGTNNKFRNFGTPTTPLSSGTANKTQYIWTPNASNFDTGLKFQRMYFSDMPTGIHSSVSAYYLDNELLCNIGSYTSPCAVAGLENTQIKGIRATSVGSTWANAYGTHFADYFTSATAGGLTINFGLPSPSSLSSQFTTSLTPTAYSGFDDTGIKLVTVGDTFTYENTYFILGHTSFQNVDPTWGVVTNQANHTVEYDLNTGSGYSGTWKTLTGANLSAETISPSTGFKIKIRGTCTVADNTNRLGKVTILTNSTASAQANNLYPLDVSTLSFTGLQPGSEVRCYTGSDPATAVEIGGIESTSGSTFSFTHSSGGSVGYIRILAMGYQPLNYDPYTYSSSDTSILVQQVVDRNYYNPA